MFNNYTVNVAHVGGTWLPVSYSSLWYGHVRDTHARSEFEGPSPNPQHLFSSACCEVLPTHVWHDMSTNLTTTTDWHHSHALTCGKLPMQHPQRSLSQAQKVMTIGVIYAGALARTGWDWELFAHVFIGINNWELNSLDLFDGKC